MTTLIDELRGKGMARSSRRRKIFQWAGLATCFVLLAAWAFSALGGVLVYYQTWGGACALGTGGIGVNVGSRPWVRGWLPRLWLSQGNVWYYDVRGELLAIGGIDVVWESDATAPGCGYAVIALPHLWLPRFDTNNRGASVLIPHWVLLVGIGIPTCVAWWRDVRCRGDTQ